MNRIKNMITTKKDHLIKCAVSALSRTTALLTVVFMLTLTALTLAQPAHAQVAMPSPSHWNLGNWNWGMPAMPAWNMPQMPSWNWPSGNWLGTSNRDSASHVPPGWRNPHNPHSALLHKPTTPQHISIWNINWFQPPNWWSTQRPGNPQTQHGTWNPWANWSFPSGGFFNGNFNFPNAPAAVSHDFPRDNVAKERAKVQLAQIDENCRMTDQQLANQIAQAIQQARTQHPNDQFTVIIIHQQVQALENQRHQQKAMCDQQKAQLQQIIFQNINVNVNHPNIRFPVTQPVLHH